VWSFAIDKQCFRYSSCRRCGRPDTSRSRIAIRPAVIAETHSVGGVRGPAASPLRAEDHARRLHRVSHVHRNWCADRLLLRAGVARRLIDHPSHCGRCPWIGCSGSLLAVVFDQSRIRCHKAHPTSTALAPAAVQVAVPQHRVGNLKAQSEFSSRASKSASRAQVVSSSASPKVRSQAATTALRIKVSR